MHRLSAQVLRGYGVSLVLAAATCGNPGALLAGGDESPGPPLPPGEIAVYLGSPDSTVTLIEPYPIGGRPDWVGIADLNGDGIPDLAVANAESESLAVLLGLGDGSFREPSFAFSGKKADYGVIGDVTGDGIPDVLLTDRGSTPGELWVLEGRGDGFFGAPFSVSLGDPVFQFALADLDGDGRLDLAVTHIGPEGPLKQVGHLDVRLGIGREDFSEPVFTDTLAAAALSIADFDRDGRADLAVTRLLFGAYVYAGNGDGSFRAPQPACTGLGPFSMIAGDLDRDGALDLVVSNMISGITVLRGRGDGTFIEPDTTAGCRSVSLDSGTSFPGIGDVNGDGALDLVLLPESGNAIQFWWGTGDGTLISGGAIEARQRPRSLAVDDLDGDGIADIALVSHRGPDLPGATSSAPAEPADFAQATLTAGVVMPRGGGLQYAKTGGGLDLRFVPRVSWSRKINPWVSLGFRIYPGTDSTAVIDDNGADVPVRRSEFEWSLHGHAGLQIGSKSPRAVIHPRFGLGPGLYYFGTDAKFEGPDVEFTRKFNHQFRAGWRAILGADVSVSSRTALDLELVFDQVWGLNQLPGGYGAEHGGRYFTAAIGIGFWSPE
jgi:hypothetical protein